MVDEAFPCSISGYQTFTIATRVDDEPNSARPLWVRMRGGGAGWFDAEGKPQPDDDNMTEEGFAAQRKRFRENGLSSRIFDQDAGFRGVAVSMCNRDVYAGSNDRDPHNPHPDADGNPRGTNGLLATKAAIQFTTEHHATTQYPADYLSLIVDWVDERLTEAS